MKIVSVLLAAVAAFAVLNNSRDSEGPSTGPSTTSETTQPAALPQGAVTPDILRAAGITDWAVQGQTVIIDLPGFSVKENGNVSLDEFINASAPEQYLASYMYGQAGDRAVLSGGLSPYGYSLNNSETGVNYLFV